MTDKCHKGKGEEKEEGGWVILRGRGGGWMDVHYTKLQAFICHGGIQHDNKDPRKEILSTIFSKKIVLATALKS